MHAWTMRERRRSRRRRTREARRIKTRLFYRRLMADLAPRYPDVAFMSETEFLSQELLALTSGESKRLLTGR